MNGVISYRKEVKSNGKTSTTKVLGPNSTIKGSMTAGILYLICTVDFPSHFHDKFNIPVEDKTTKEAIVMSVVDDNNFTIKEKDNGDLIETMKDNLEMSEEYTSQNELALNSKKTKIFTISKDGKVAKNHKLPSDIPDKPIVNYKQINMLAIMISR